MKKLLTFLIFSISFVSCDPCANLDCISDSYQVILKLVNANDGRDLVFGPSKIYDTSEIRFYSLRGNDTVQLEQNFYIPGDTMLAVRFTSDLPIAYMRLSADDTDTLLASYDTYKSRCCGMITNVTGLRFNAQPGVQPEDDIYIIRK